MAFKLARATRESTPTTGVIDVDAVIELSGPTDIDLQSFVVAVGDTNQTIARIVTGDGSWQEMVVTVSDAAPDALVVDEIIATSEAANAPITLVGDTRVFGIISPDFSKLFDLLFGVTEGTVPVRGPSVWAGDVISGAGSFVISDATDVDTTGAADGSLLRYDAGASEWQTLVRGAPGSTLKSAASDIEWAYTNQQEAVTVVSTSPLPGTPTYSNGTGGTGATLTATSNGALVVDGVTMTTNNVRVLVAGQADPIENGAFRVTQFGDGSNPYIIERTTDWDGDTVAAGGVRLGDTFAAYQGDNNIGIWVFSASSTVGAVVFGTSELAFTKVASVVDITSFISGTLTSLANNDILVYDTGEFKNKRPSYQFAFSAPQTTAYTASQVIGHHDVAAAITIPANFGSYLGLSSRAGGSANATASTVFNVDQAAAATPNTWTTIGTITFAIGTVTPTFATTGGTAKNIADNDRLRIVAPASPDATFVGFYASIIAQRQ